MIARYNSRADDWNIAASRLLSAGKYVLDVQSAAPPDVSAPSAPSADSSADDDDTDEGGAAQTAATQGTTPPAKDAPAQDASDSSDTSDKPTPTVDVRLTLPAALPPVPAPTQTATLEGNGVHVLTLPRPEPGSLLVAVASGTAPSVVALERAEAAGWQTVALASGRAPVVAAPADGNPADWRLESWTIDGGPEPIHLAARAVTSAPQSGSATLAAIDSLPVSLAVARASLPDAGIAAISGAPPGLLAGGWPGHALEPAGGNVIVSGTDLWLLAAQPGSITVRPLDFGPGSVVQLPAGLSATLRGPTPPDGHVAMWRVSSGSGQPNMGVASGIAEASSVALASHPVSLRAGTEPMRLVVNRDTPTLLPGQTVAATLQTVVPAGSALPLTLPPGDKTLEVSLAAGLAAFADWHGALPTVVWSAGNTVSRTLDGSWTELLLVNTGSTPAPARIALQPAAAARTLQPGMITKRFFGAAGSFAVAFDAPPGSSLMTAGDATAVAVTDTGITHGSAAAIAGPGRAVIQHGLGAIAVWIQAPGTPAWADPPSQTVSLPAQMALSGPATALSFDAPSAALLHISTTAPVFAGLQQTGRTDPPALFAAGPSCTAPWRPARSA